MPRATKAEMVGETVGSGKVINDLLHHHVSDGSNEFWVVVDWWRLGELCRGMLHRWNDHGDGNR